MPRPSTTDLVAASAHDVVLRPARGRRDGRDRGRGTRPRRQHDGGVRRPAGLPGPGRRSADRRGPASRPVHHCDPRLPDVGGRRAAGPAHRRARTPWPARVTSPDGLVRCPWAESTPDYTAYHDQEWGRPVRDDRGLFERLTLEAFQSGLSWLTILRKREAFRRAFADFDVAVVAAYDEQDVGRLLADTGIVRNRAKIEAAVVNARAVVTLDEPLTELLWSFAPTGPRRAPRTLADVPSLTPESTAMAKALKARGF